MTSYPAYGLLKVILMCSSILRRLNQTSRRMGPSLFVMSLIISTYTGSSWANPTKPEASSGSSRATPQYDRANITYKCEDLLPGQYYCDNPDINPKMQQPYNCSRETRTAPVRCYPVQGITCGGQDHSGAFLKHIACKWTNGHSFSVALLLSVFLGMFGVDRFYLGYPAIGLLKLCTLGFMFLGQLVDILLIALQVVRPSDKSDYVIDYFGPGLTYISENNYTYIQPHYEH